MLCNTLRLPFGNNFSFRETILELNFDQFFEMFFNKTYKYTIYIFCKTVQIKYLFHQIDLGTEGLTSLIITYIQFHQTSRLMEQ